MNRIPENFHFISSTLIKKSLNFAWEAEVFTDIYWVLVQGAVGVKSGEEFCTGYEVKIP